MDCLLLIPLPDLLSGKKRQHYTQTPTPAALQNENDR
ncbi:hypothetical protein SAMN05192529_1282 [Arachidicoccus rhizosphaerae]|uniref:Uncharacterized protein n=1 Tax=Arachidicoccus rhizosphaerae TaxID=551991 RepID=A0A1H4C6W2_9BACT|nr:hypothetical protein SAMN05192529_1282 [Arachidicoccus rhizosphaerae]